MKTTRKKLLLTTLLCLTLTAPLCGCGILPGLSRPTSEVTVTIASTDPSQIAINWTPTRLPIDQTEVTITPEGVLTITIRLLPPQ